MDEILKNKHYWQRQKRKYNFDTPQWFICWHRAMFYDQLYTQKVEERDGYLRSQDLLWPYAVVQD